MKSVLIIGLGRFGMHMAQRLSELGAEVLAIDLSETRVNEAASFVTSAQIGDCTNEALIASLGVRNFDACVVAIGDNFQSSLEITSLLKDHGAPRVLARASHDVHAKFLLRNGADQVYYPEKQTARRAATEISSDSIFDFIELSPEYSIYELGVPRAWTGKNLIEIDARTKHRVNVVALKQNDRVQPLVQPDYRFTGAERLFVIGTEKDIYKLIDDK